jgi:hypothetical protein
VLSLDQSDQLLAACAKFKPEGEDEYDLSLLYTSIIFLSAALGPRRIELRDLTVEDFESFKPNLRIRTHKSGKGVIRELPDEAVKAVDKYLKAVRLPAGAKPSDALLSRGYTNDGLSLRGLSYIFNRIKEEAGIEEEGMGFHSRRRGLVSEMAQNGASDKTITVEMGWSSDSTVLRYQHLTSKFVKNAIRKANPMLMREIQSTEPSQSEPTITRPPVLQTPARRNEEPKTLLDFKAEDPAPIDTTIPAPANMTAPIPDTASTNVTAKPKTIMERYRERDADAEKMKGMTLSQRLEFIMQKGKKAKTQGNNP